MGNAIQMDVSSLDRLARELTKYPVHAKSILEDGIGEGKKAAIKAIPRTVPVAYTIPAAQVKKSMKSRGVRRIASGSSFGLEVRGPALNLADFSHYPTVPKGRQGTPMVAVRQGPSRILRPRLGQDGQPKPPFLALNSHRADARYLYFRRTGVYKLGTRREKITSVLSVSIPQMVQTPEVQEPLLGYVNQAVDRKMNQELDDLLSRMKGTVEG